jgi:hypothetical protein
MSFKRKASTKAAAKRTVYNPNKMDTTRAQGILGFTSARLAKFYEIVKTLFLFASFLKLLRLFFLTIVTVVVLS